MESNTEIGESLSQNRSSLMEEPEMNEENGKTSSDSKSQSAAGSDESSEDDTPIIRTMKRVQRFSESDDEFSQKSLETGAKIDQTLLKSHSDSDSKDAPSVNASRKSRLRLLASNSDNTSDSESNRTDNDEEESRIKNKRSKLTQKFKCLVSSRHKEPEKSFEHEYDSDHKNRASNNSSEDEASSIERIKKIIKEKIAPLKSTIYDPDTSDEEGNMSKKVQIPKKGRKSTKSSSPKPMRMSAKQALENMQKIKSESNRMLREKDVSLPYHRPKALLLKDIMSRRKPAITADGKALPIKMNEEQLKQYAQLLDQRQKEIMELCKSDTDEETPDHKEESKKDVEDQADEENNADTLYDNLSQANVSVTQNIDHDKEQLDTSTEEVKEQHNGNSCVDTNALIDSDKAIDIQKSDQVSTMCSLNESMSKEASVDQIDPHPDSSNATKENTELYKNDTGEMELIYNNSVEENPVNIEESILDSKKNTEINSYKAATIETEVDSQLISLHYDSEKMDNAKELTNNNSKTDFEKTEDVEMVKNDSSEKSPKNSKHNKHNDDFSDDEVNMDEIDALIENAVIATSHDITDANSPMLVKDPQPLKSKPKLTGAPGMVIDLDGTDPLIPKKLSGVELLKERFVYFAKLKTPEELERDKEKRIKPGTQHLKLKQELEDQIAEQRSLEWSKRLEEEKRRQEEYGAIIGDETEDAEEDIDKIEAKLEEEEGVGQQANESSSESEEEIEEEQEIPEKRRKRNPMVDDEAEESDCDDDEDNDMDTNEEEPVNDEANGIEEDVESEEEPSSDESEESEVDNQKPKKGRILKAFEDSDEEDSNIKSNNTQDKENIPTAEITTENDKTSAVEKGTQDDELQLAQVQKTVSDDLFTSQESELSLNKEKPNSSAHSTEDKDFDTQTFNLVEYDGNKNNMMELPLPDKLCGSQAYDDNLDAVAGMCSGSFSQTQNLVTPTQSQLLMPESQVIGEDVLALCTGKFYDNEFVSQQSGENSVTSKDREDILSFKDTSDNSDRDVKNLGQKDFMENNNTAQNKKNNKDNQNVENKTDKEDDNLKSILDELNDPEFDKPKVNKYFPGDTVQDKENKLNVANTQLKKKFVIDSDDEENKDSGVSKKKKLKKKKLEQRALQISDDEEDEQLSDQELEEDYESAVEDDEEKIVEYDSDENEVIVQPQNPKKKRKTAEFFEQEAELTSEDEWVGSGDEDEHGLDRMEREEGDDDKFNQDKLQRELGQIHMRDVLDQDKREVRLIQELLFEDGDLGDGQRQRKFRWKNADGDDLTGTPFNDLTDTQEEEFESEEQWRKQRHEREVFLRALKNKDEPEDLLNISVNRTSIIKANLSNTTSSLFKEINTSVEKTSSPAAVPEKKTTKDIPSPKKPFSIMQQNYHGSILTRGRGALARLAALATPLANDDDTPKIGSLAPSSKRNFVFAAIDPTPEEEQPKVTKRKAEGSIGTPKLVKKMRTEEKQKYSKSSLLDYMKT